MIPTLGSVFSLSGLVFEFISSKYSSKNPNNPQLKSLLIKEEVKSYDRGL